jgi:hypothetical protein
MRSLLTAALLLIPAAALAGCAADDAPPEPHIHYVTIPRPVNVIPYEPCFGFVGNADLAGISASLPNGQRTAYSVFDNGASMEVPPNTTAIILDMWWQSGAATSIRAHVVGPDGTVTQSEPRTSTTPDDPIRIRFDDPMPGAYRWTGVADPVAAGVVLHLNEGLYFERPEDLGFICNVAGAANGQ